MCVHQFSYFELCNLKFLFVNKCPFNIDWENKLHHLVLLQLTSPPLAIVWERDHINTVRLDKKEFS